MQYVRSIGGSVSKTWNSINPATLSGAIDVIVVEQVDGSLACSPFHVRFGKFSLLRPYEKKVEFEVNNIKQGHAMKLGEGGEAFFVFETSDEIPENLQTSPIASPATSPHGTVQDAPSLSTLQEPDFLDITNDEGNNRSGRSIPGSRSFLTEDLRAQSEYGNITPLSVSPDYKNNGHMAGHWSGSRALPIHIKRSASEELLPSTACERNSTYDEPRKAQMGDTLPPRLNSPIMTMSVPTERSHSPPPVSPNEAVSRAISLSKKLSGSNIPTHVTDSGDLKLDMTGYKSSEDDALRAEVIARKILAEELEGNYDIGALIGADEQGNLWIYSSEEAKEAASRKLGPTPAALINDATSDPGYNTDEERTVANNRIQASCQQRQSGASSSGPATPPKTPPAATVGSGDPNRNYAKTLRLTSDQLKDLKLKRGSNTMRFSVNRAICQACMYFWTYDVPIVISDIDGTITKSDALGHVLNMIGRDWTHTGVAKLYTDIAANGYNILYLTSRSVGQADTTRAYLNGVSQDGFKLPKGPVIMSPDRTIAALRREIYLRKPEVFKMACLRDILNLFSYKMNPFYAGFGNRLTDALSYRSVNIPSTRIFTINSNAEVSLDLLTLNKYKISYVSMREVVDHFFPPVGLLVAGEGEEFTDFNYWRDSPLGTEEFDDSDGEDQGKRTRDHQSVKSEDDGSEGLEYDEQEDELGESYLSRDSLDGGDEMVDSIIRSIEDETVEKSITNINDDEASLPIKSMPSIISTRTEVRFDK